jgi:superfamily I DNA/RNA helicase
MSVQIEISNKEINYAEKILLPEGQRFDDERRKFIKNLDTIDLQAVPGSGKTTALLAKLLILDRKLPFQDGSGILVISHTNAAVNEIRRKIDKYTSHILLYPNFIGTIQGFVDRFLAIPFYSNSFKQKPIRIDNELYCEMAQKYSNVYFNKKDFTNEEQIRAKYYLNVNDNAHKYRFSYIGNKVTLLLRQLNIVKPHMLLPDV